MRDRLTHLQHLKQKAKDGYEHYKPAFDELDDAYFLIYRPELLDSLRRRNKSRNYIPKINSKAKRIYDGLTETYFNNDRFAKLEPYINSTNDVIDKWQEAIDHYTEMLNLYRVFSPIFLRAPFSASSVVKVYWDKDKVAIDEIALEDVYFDPDARGLKDINYIINRIYLTNDDIKRLNKQGVFKLESTDFLDEPYLRQELYEIYELVDDVWQVSTILDNEILRDGVKLKDGQPFIVGYMLPQIRKSDEEHFVSAYGEPALACALPLQHELNINRNTITDVVRQQLTPKLILDKAAMIERNDLEILGAPIYSNEPRAVQILPSGDIGGAMATLNIIDNELSEVTGISPQNTGANTVRKETATMASIMANEGGVRLQGYIRTFNETFFEPIFERLAFLVWKYADPVFFAGFGRLGGVPSFKVNLNTGIGALNKEVQKKSLMDVGGLIAGQFQMCLNMQDMQGARRMQIANEKLLAELLPLYGIKDTKNFLNQDDYFDEVANPQTIALRQQQEQMALMQEQTQGGLNA